MSKLAAGSNQYARRGGPARLATPVSDLVAQAAASDSPPLQWEPMDQERKALLQARIQPGSRYATIQDRLLSEIGGDALVVAYGWSDPVLAELAARGQRCYQPTRVQPGEPRACHTNAARLAIYGLAAQMVVGYALSAFGDSELSDGAWREHSWAMSADGYIIETTSPRTVYFGVPVTVRPGPDQPPNTNWSETGSGWDRTDLDENSAHIRKVAPGRFVWEHLWSDMTALENDELEGSEPEIEDNPGKSIQLQLPHRLLARGETSTLLAAMVAADNSIDGNWGIEPYG